MAGLEQELHTWVLSKGVGYQALASSSEALASRLFLSLKTMLTELLEPLARTFPSSEHPD